MPYGKGAGRAWKLATAAAERAGYSDFTKGSLGARKRSQIAEAIAKKTKKK